MKGKSTPKGWAWRFLAALLLLFVTLADGGAQGPVPGEDMFLLSFGAGKTRVKLFADYFCGPCRTLEPQVEPVIADLVRRRIITITFVDAPFHRRSSLYTRYFLYIVNERKELHHALAARAVLFEAAKAKLETREQLEEFLTARGVKFKPFDAAPVFRTLEGYIREDKINATPACTILRNDKKSLFTGPADIVKALKELR